MLVVFLLQAVVMFALGVFVFDADGPDELLSLLAVMLLGGDVRRPRLRQRGAHPLRRERFCGGEPRPLPMAFISGSFVPTQEYPEWLQTLGDVLPLKHLIDLLRGVYLDGMPIWDAPGSVAALAAWGAAGALVASRRFGWEPRER